MNVTTMNAKQLVEIGELGKRRADIADKLERLDRGSDQLEYVHVKFSFRHEQDFGEQGRGVTPLAKRLMQTTIEHFKEELVEVNVGLRQLGVEIVP